MEQIQKAAHYRSFYETAKKMKDPMTRLAFYDAVDAYRFDGTEPENLPFEADLAFTAIRSFIDADCGRKCGGAPLGNQNARKHNKNNAENNLKNKCENNQLFQPETNKEEEKEEVEGNEEEEVKDAVVSPSTVLFFDDTSMYTNINRTYSKQVFEILRDNDMPCCNKNEISFAMQDFKNAMDILHTRPDLRGIHSNDVLMALKNYIGLIKRPDVFEGYANKKRFDEFVGWKEFRNFMPGTFEQVKIKFLKFNTGQSPENKGNVGLDRLLQMMNEEKG